MYTVMKIILYIKMEQHIFLGISKSIEIMTRVIDKIL